jgi:hypothetical protein
MVLKLRKVDKKHLERSKFFDQQIHCAFVGQKTLILSKCTVLQQKTWKGAEEGWRSSYGPIVCEMKNYYIESRRRSISYVQLKKDGKIDGSYIAQELPSEKRYWMKDRRKVRSYWQARKKT